MMMRPPWLADEPEILGLLHAVLDLFDQQSGKARDRAVFLPAERHLKSLARNDTAADQLWALVESLEVEGLLEVREARRSPYDSRWIGAKLAFALDSEETLRSWLARLPTERAMLAWQRVVAAHADAFPASCEPLMQRRITLAGRTAEEVVGALARLGKLTGSATLRQLSAFAFWGDSKVLDERGDLVAALFPKIELLDRAIVVAVHLPRHPDGILFIENQDTYTAAVRGSPIESRSLALVYASGFLSSAQRIRERSGATLHYAGVEMADSIAPFDQWWFEAGAPLGACWFWGDLDFAGMHILKALRQRFGDVNAWQPGYESMLNVIQIGGGYSGTDARGQVDPIVTGCFYADGILLPAIREFGQLDQECVAVIPLSR